jgi:hypothetical protein
MNKLPRHAIFQPVFRATAQKRQQELAFRPRCAATTISRKKSAPGALDLPFGQTEGFEQ